MKILIWIIVGLVLTQACHQTSPKTSVAVISVENLKVHIKHLASAELKGRKTNEKGYLLAAEYVEEYCREIKLKPFFANSSPRNTREMFFQHVPFLDYQYGPDNWLTFKADKKLSIEKDYFLLNAGTISGEISIDSILFAGYGIHEPDMGWDDYTGTEIKGKYVMIVDGSPDKKEFPEIDRIHSKTYNSLARKINFLYREGASGLIIVSETSKKYWDLSAKIHQKLGYKPTEPSFWADPYHSELPVLMIHPDIFKNFHPEVELVLDMENYQKPYFFKSEIEISIDVMTKIFEAPNVAGIIHGSDSGNASSYIVLGAHLDHIGAKGDEIFYGANDNASSCAALLEVAKELIQNPPKRSVIIVFYAAEEPCLWGSQYFVSHFPKDKEKILVNINVEMIGKKDKGNMGTTAIGPEMFESYFSNTVPLRVNYLKLEDHKGKYNGSDQLSYYRDGIPAIRFGNLDFPEKHTSKDNIDIINFEYLEAVTATLLGIVYGISNE